MQVRYYVLPIAGEYKVLRDGRGKGTYPCRSRAVDAARFMAAIEADASGAPIEVLVDDGSGRLECVCTALPTRRTAA